MGQSAATVTRRTTGSCAGRERSFAATEQRARRCALVRRGDVSWTKTPRTIKQKLRENSRPRKRDPREGRQPSQVRRSPAKVHTSLDMASTFHIEQEGGGVNRRHPSISKQTGDDDDVSPFWVRTHHTSCFRDIKRNSLVRRISLRNKRGIAFKGDKLNVFPVRSE